MWLLKTSWPRYALAIAAVNTAGAAAIALIISLVAPVPATLAIAGLAVGVVAVSLGVASTFFLFRPVLAWRKDPDSFDRAMVQQTVMRIPRLQTIVGIVVWAVATAVFYVISQSLAILICMAVGLVLVAVLTFLSAKILIRPAANRVFSGQIESHRRETGPATRIVLTWVATTCVPMVALMAFMQPNMAVIVGVVTVLVFGAVATVLVTSIVSDPIRDVCNAVDSTRRGELGVRVPLYDGGDIGTMQAGFNEMIRGLRDGKRTKRMLETYVGKSVANRALRETPQLGGESRKVAVLFVDVVGSTTYATQHTPQEVVIALNEFFERVVAVVHEYHGSINKFQGDAALAIFGAPNPLPDSTGNALAAARELRARLQNVELGAGIGVATGTVVAGHIGARERYEYTVIGDAVNSASRLTDLAKTTPGGVLTTAATLRDAGEAEQARWTLMKSVELRGRSTLTRLARPIRPTLADRS